MSFTGSSRRRRNELRYSPLAVALIVMLVLQIWVCFDDHCKAEAIRELPPPVNNANHYHHPPRQILSKLEEEKLDEKTRASKEELFRKFFAGRASASNSDEASDKGFEDSKRRVPSCPDPLHN